MTKPLQLNLKPATITISSIDCDGSGAVIADVVLASGPGFSEEYEGSNPVRLTVINDETGETVVDNEPMERVGSSHTWRYPIEGCCGFHSFEATLHCKTTYCFESSDMYTDYATENCGS